MLDQREVPAVAPGLIAGTVAEPQLIGSSCRQCGTVTFPRQSSCPRCTSEDVEERLLGRRGTLWTWTIQCFRPKSPPYAGPPGEEFAPYGVGYVELPGEVRVEARLTEHDATKLRIGMPMVLALIPAPGDPATMTFAFRPADEDEEAPADDDEEAPR
jgi:uncharacterized OB-fold protein